MIGAMGEEVQAPPSPSAEPMSADAQRRMYAFLEVEVRLTREAVTQQGQTLTLMNNTLMRFDATLGALCDFLKANTAQLANADERLTLLEARVAALEGKPVATGSSTSNPLVPR